MWIMQLRSGLASCMAEWSTNPETLMPRLVEPFPTIFPYNKLDLRIMSDETIHFKIDWNGTHQNNF